VTTTDDKKASGSAEPLARLPLACPLCTAPLVVDGRALRCPARHTFDIAKEGYVSFLVGEKKGALVGDSEEMLRARRTFLARDHYKALDDTLADVIIRHLAGTPPAPDAPHVVVDVGAGEGHMITAVRTALTGALADDAQQNGLVCVGTDIAKEGMRMAAKRDRASAFLVADTLARLPFQDQSVRVLLNVLAVRHIPEFARVLAKGGLLVVVIPLSHHLEELRTTLPLLQIAPDKEETLTRALADDFRGLERIKLEIPLSLTDDDLRALFTMMPSSRHHDVEQVMAARAVHASAAQNGNAAVTATAAFQIVSFTRR
jgi:23S rRNA (guanine745-N1)-methyltransferase